MTRSLATFAALAGCLTFGGVAAAQDMEFSADETEAGAAEATPAPDSPAGDAPAGDGGEMSFDVVDTGKAAAEVEKAQIAERESIRVIQRNPFLRRERVEVAPMLGTNLNDPLVRVFLAGGNLNYHINEVLAVGVHGAYSLGSETDLFDQVIEDYELFPQVSKVQWLAGLHFQYVPIYGKFTLFNSWIIPWDTYVELGAGYTKTELDGHPTLSAGLGQRYFMNRWFSVNVELRDHIYNETYPAGDSLVNNLTFTAGVGFFLPPDFEYTTLK